MTTNQNPTSIAALSVLVVLQLTMLGALFTQTSPHPPLSVPIFALGPFIGAAISVAVAAIVLGGTSSRPGLLACVISGVLALVSYGPQKWVDPAIGEIWPAVLLGQAAALILIIQPLRQLYSQSQRSTRT